MKKALVFLGIFSAVIFSCSQQEEKKTTTKKEVYNPNGDSELALAMRQSFEQTEQIKLNLEKGDLTIPEGYIDNLKFFHSATPTDSTVKTEVFTQFSNSLYSIANDLVSSSDLNKRKEVYQTLISTCISCHQTFCPGPIVRIKKLNLN
ncbi:MAG: hypothetical protein ACLGGV_04655 [Bacteroidia bacterium]